MKRLVMRVAEERAQDVGYKTWKGEHHFGYEGVGDWMVLNWVLQKEDVTLWVGLDWLSIGCGEHLMIHWVRKP